jgi:hypothetical protein
LLPDQALQFMLNLALGLFIALDRLYSSVRQHHRPMLAPICLLDYVVDRFLVGFRDCVAASYEIARRDLQGFNDWVHRLTHVMENAELSLVPGMGNSQQLAFMMSAVY